MADIALRAVPDAWSKTRGWLERQRRGVMLVLLVLMFVIAALAPRIFITIPSGHGGILWLRFFGGTQTQLGALGEGLHIVFPWDHIFIYDMRVQEHDQAYEVIAREGLQVTVRSSFRWQLNRATLARLHKEIGPNYLNVLMVPEVGSVLRERISQYNIEELFSSRRTQIQREILQAVAAEAPGESVNRIGNKSGDMATDDYVTLTDILLKDITLPFRLRSAIERKLEQAQISQEYNFRIQRERLESERKQIEAQGIQAFQQTVQAGISDAYLKWRGIEATLQLATSPNSKVVIVGGGSQGLPLILNTDDSSSRRAPSVAAEPAQPAKAQKADAEQGGKIAGSVDMSPPATNTSLERLINPAGVDEGDEDDAKPAAKPRASARLNEPAGSDTPPYILRSFANAFGYRLQPASPGASASADVVGPNERPR
ncbi:prohibitin family protein [Hyphomicrobium sp.]|uniref:prohibitin family protein n=1 Tax=Hyphomicrobium sp. TaxID=82 RepID=UPI002E326BFA|nr:prohibitin family protein [Hyphomicrobium sp.]HEX2841875.1 prohibitin family protein [Hyphomicrobium sp.]